MSDSDLQTGTQETAQGTTSDVYMSSRKTTSKTLSDSVGDAGADFNFLSHFWAEIQNWFDNCSEMMSGQSWEVKNAKAEEIKWEVINPTWSTFNYRTWQTAPNFGGGEVRVNRYC